MEAQAKYKTTEIAPLGIVEITEANLAVMKKQIIEIPAMPENKGQYTTARSMNIQVKKLKPRIEERRKEKKRPYLEKCREIDDAAKKAQAMIQPLIEMSGDRRAAWEDIAKKEKECERARESFRLDCIMGSMSCLNSAVDQCLKNGVGSNLLKLHVETLTAYPTTEALFQEHLETAQGVQANGLIAAQMALENRIKFEADQAKFEADQAKFEADQKAQAEAQAKLNAANKAEADRLAKIAADQEAEVARVKAEQGKAAKKRVADQAKKQAKIDAANAKAKADQEAQAKKLADEKASFEAEKKAARIAINDSCYTEALSIHRTFAIIEFMPSALELNAEITQARRDAMDAQAKRNMDLLRNRNAVDAMTRNILDALEMGKPGVDMPEIEKHIAAFECHLKADINNMTLSVAGVK